MTYQTIEDHFKTNGDRHLERAFDHYYHRYPPRYWQGSLDKALKNYKKADALKFDPLIEAMMKPMMDMIERQIENAIMFGVTYTKINDDGTVTPIDDKDFYK